MVAGPAVGGVVDGGGMNAARDGGRREDEVKLPRGRRGGLTRAVVAGHAGAVRWQLIRPGIGLAAAVGVLRPDEGEAERLSAVEDALVAVAVVGVAVLTTPGQTIDLTPICWSSDGDRVSAACGGGRSASRRRVGKMACITRSSSGHTRLQDLWHARETNWPLMYCRDSARPDATKLPAGRRRIMCALDIARRRLVAVRCPAAESEIHTVVRDRLTQPSEPEAEQRPERVLAGQK